MPAAISVEAGTCLGFGGTNARIATCDGGDLLDFSSVETPTQPEQFFQWMARNLLDASHQGSAWLVAGFPGPVSPDGKIVGPLINVSGMRAEEYDLRDELAAADPEINRVLDQGFTLLAVNDGTLAAQAAASRVGQHKYGKTGALIFGTGVGAGVVEKDGQYSNVHRVDSNPLEIGHLLVSDQGLETFEERYSGPGIQRRYGIAPKDLDSEHPVWIEEGEAVGRLSTMLGLISRVELVVPTGGIGIGASDKYASHLRAYIESYRNGKNSTQKKFIPEIILVPPQEAEQFEMYGAEGVVRDHLV
jgi:predicted NBD/HSP70 family sugar kinase